MTRGGRDVIGLCGVNVGLFTAEQLIEAITEAGSNRTGTCFDYVNANTINLSRRDPGLSAFLNSEAQTWCDGFGALLGLRVLGNEVSRDQRVTMPDHLETLFAALEARRLRVMIVAQRPQEIAKTLDVIEQRHPDLEVVGRSGYFDRPRVVSSEIALVRPDVLFLGMGQPLQERFVSAHGHAFDSGAVVCVGAAFDFVGGSVARGPRWMTDNGLEWLSRLLAEPRRLAARYLVGNVRFLMAVARQRLRD